MVSLFATFSTERSPRLASAHPLSIGRQEICTEQMPKPASGPCVLDLKAAVGYQNLTHVQW